MNLKRFFLCTLAAISMLVTSCSPEEEVTVEVANVTLSKTEITLEIGESATIVATVTPSDATVKTVTWASSNTSVATVNSSGEIKAVAEGSTTITASAGTKLATCAVNVTKPNLVVTGEASNITWTSAVLKFKVLLDKAGSYGAFDAGITISKTDGSLEVGTTEYADLLIEKDKDGNPDLSGEYTLPVEVLESDKTYYYRAWAKFDGQIYYGEKKSFTSAPLVVETDKMVDLGLSVKWAAYNIGATKPEEIGDYFAWGETAPKSNGYNWLTYAYGYEKSLTKYCTQPNYGDVDDRTVLTPSDDAATVAWGDKWRMPTNDEKFEFLRNTYNTPYTLNGVAGYLFTSKVNGKSIFIPSEGLKIEFKTELPDFCGFWTSTLHTEENSYARLATNKIPNSTIFENAGFDMETLSGSFAVSWMRCVGMSVRAVYGDNTAVYKVGVSMQGVGAILSDGATVSAVVEDLALCGKTVSDVSEYGICYSSSNAVPTVSDLKVNGVGTLAADGKFSVQLTSLAPETQWYCRAYAVISGTTYYSAARTFTTWGDISMIDESAELVDLGLSVKWAGWNLGATKPQEPGGFYAWAETSPKVSYTTDNYLYYSGGYSKYNTLDKFKSIRPVDDAAFMKLGGNWQMPTSAQWNELVTKATWKYTIYKGVAGFVVTGTTGKAIFLPCAGVQDGTNLKYEGQRGYYWNTDLNESAFYEAKCGLINKENINFNYQYSRYCGLSVRPVWGAAPLSSAVESVSFKSSSYKLKEGETVQTEIKLTPIDPLNANVSYSSSNTLVATVDAKGLVTAVSKGSCTITVTTQDGGKTATCTINVVKNFTLETGAVDLGLSVLWNSCNVGGTQPEDYGDYYMWGCTDRSKHNYKNHPLWSSVTGKFSKYNYYDHKTKLQAEDDAATEAMGSGWRTPTKEEMEELVKECSWSEEEYNGTRGFLVTGPSGKAIFLPLAGYCDQYGNIVFSYQVGRYMTATFYEQLEDYEYYALIAMPKTSSEESDFIKIMGEPRVQSATVRAVRSK